MIEASLDNTIALLGRTPATLNVLLRELPAAWTLCNEGGSTWSVFDVVGHLLHAEYADWIPRARWIIQFGDSRPFEPFDRSGHEPLTQGKSLEQLLDDFAEARSQSLAGLRAMNLQAADFERRGRHPALGAVTLSQLLATWAAHDVNHLHQISRIMAYQYRDAVGPWSRFLGVMHCDGHSQPA
ncbi:MAG TPA: DinB family protein [Terracidiphilus sp.]|nr:DinB family protein [Terracidiphilus sp.]